MSETKHTPGPWRWQRSTTPGAPGTFYRIQAVRKTDGGEVRLCLAEVRNEARAFGISAQANARLIAAAPDLLEACVAAHAALEAIASNAPVHVAALDLLRAALAKATTVGAGGSDQ